MIRPTIATDLEGLTRVIDATGLFPSAMLDAMITPYLSEAESRDIGLTDDENGPVALLYCAPERLTDGSWNILLIVVDPSVQRCSRGRQLIGAVEQRLAGLGDILLLVETSGLPQFQATRAFYQGLGCVEEARIRDFYKAGEDKITFWKTLNPNA